MNLSSFFWFKKKEVILDCFTPDNYAFKYCRPEPAVKYYPQWWQDLPKLSDDGRSTMKRCRGFQQLYKNSFIIPYWTQMNISMGSTKERAFTWNSPDRSKLDLGQLDLVTFHPPRQYTNFIDTDRYQHIKLTQCWRFNTSKYVDFLWSDCTWNRTNFNYTILPGIMDFKYQAGAEINMLLEYIDEPYDISFSPGQPLVMITPVDQTNTIVIKHHLVTVKEWQALSPYAAAFRSKKDQQTKTGYQYAKEVTDALDHRSKPASKCPFGFTSK